MLVCQQNVGDIVYCVWNRELQTLWNSDCFIQTALLATWEWTNYYCVSNTGVRSWTPQHARARAHHSYNKAIYHARAYHSYNKAISCQSASQLYWCDKAISCRSAHQPVLVCGGFNTCNIRLTSLLPNLYQYVTCPTRLNKTLDMCYGNIPGLHSDGQTVTLYMCILNTQKLKTA